MGILFTQVHKLEDPKNSKIFWVDQQRPVLPVFTQENTSFVHPALENTRKSGCSLLSMFKQ
jgi:hypothetical protein